MTESRGNPRFKGGGSLWKSSWRRKVPFTEMCWFQDFSDDPAGNFYEDGAILGIVPAAGFFLGAVVGVSAAPAGVSGFQYIARNGAVPAEGWDLVMTDAGLDPVTGEPLVTFTFQVYDGAVPTAVATSGLFRLEVDPNSGVDLDVFRLMAWFSAPGFGNPDGAVNLWVEGQFAAGLAGVPLAAPYVNTSPLLQFGNGPTADSAFEVPNCIHGWVGGSGVPFDVTTDEWTPILEGAPAQGVTGWAYDIQEQRQIVAPVGGLDIPTLAPTNGWRANNPILGPGVAPSPLTPFLGAVTVSFANAVPPAAPLTVACSQNYVFEAQYGPPI